MPRRRSSCAIALVLSALTSPARSDERLEGIACRSVHLQYPAERGAAFLGEVTVERSAEGTYFCVLGWDKGYFGLQELRRGRKLLIFSVWDPGTQDDPEAVEDDRRVRLLHQGEGVRVGRFGNEGTGGQSFYDYDWKVGETYRLLVTAEPDGERTAYSGWFLEPESGAWRHLVTFSTITGGRLLGGYYSFVEDFRRDRVSATRERRARYGNGWVRDADGRWVALTRARFTADRNPVLNIDAGTTEEGAFYLATGGDIENTGTPLWETMDRPPMALPPSVRAPAASTAEGDEAPQDRDASDGTEEPPVEERQDEEE